MNSVNQRSGATLLEVLVAIFVMGIGLLALLVLFPLGALRMAQAIQDDRCAQACRIANALATLRGIRGDATVVSLALPAGMDPFMDPWWDASGARIAGGWKPADPDGPSFPVLVDPAGSITATGLTSEHWITNFDTTIRRRNVSFVNAPNAAEKAMRWFTLLDDVLYDIDGTGRNISPGFIERDIRYTWAYMLKRPKSANASVVDLAVLVFNRRTLALTSNLDLNESLYQSPPGPNVMGAGNEVTFDPIRNTITLDPLASSGKTLPAARTGDWLLDATYIPNTTGNYATVNGYFYRVVGQTEVGGANGGSAVEYEVQPELRNFPATGSETALRKVIFMDGLAEVFEKGPGKAP